LKIKLTVQCAGVAIGLAATSPAAAVEGGVFGGPVGGTDIGQAYLPPAPGLYGAAVFVGGTSNSYQDQNGNGTSNLNSVSHSGNPAYFQSLIQAGTLLFVYPVKPLGWTLSSSFQANYQENTQALSINPHAPISYLSSAYQGFGDSYADLLYATHYVGLLGADPGPNPNPRFKTGLSVGVGLAAEFPIGTYVPTNTFNTGKNTYMLIPNVAATYRTGPAFGLFGADGTEFSMRYFYENLYKDSVTQYKSGNLYDIDFAITERWGNTQAGIAGAFAKETQPDICGGGTCGAVGSIVAPYGNKMEKFILGPVLSQYFPELGINVKMKVTFGIHNENTYLMNTGTIVISKQLWAP
jgi:hypothetical protein